MNVSSVGTKKAVLTLNSPCLDVSFSSVDELRNIFESLDEKMHSGSIQLNVNTEGSLPFSSLVFTESSVDDIVIAYERCILNEKLEQDIQDSKELQ